MTVYHLLDGASGRPGFGSSGTTPPGSAVAYTSGPFQGATAWQVTQWGLWLAGYDWLVPAGSADTAAQEFATWQISTNLGGMLIPAATKTSGTLTANAVNFVQLATPVPVSAYVPYLCVTAWHPSTGFPETKSQFGASPQPYSAGIINGPLQVFSDVSGTNEVPNGWQAQGSFGTNSTDPTTGWPNLGSDSSSLFWIAPVLTDVAPAAASFRLRPSTPVPPGMFADTATPFTLAVEVKLSQACTLSKLWFYSPSGASILPAEIGVYNQATQTLVPGTHITSPGWSGAAGSGWVSYTYTGVTLPAGSYRLAVCSGSTSTVWNNAVNSFWGGGGPAAGGIVSGPLSAPGEATADTPGQASYNAGSSLTWPGTYNTPGSGSDYLLDGEFIPAASGSGLLMAAGII